MKLMLKTACDISYAYDAKGRLASAVPVYHYYLQDHLGNNRVVVKQDGTIEDFINYIKSLPEGEYQIKKITR